MKLSWYSTQSKHTKGYYMNKLRQKPYSQPTDQKYPTSKSKQKIKDPSRNFKKYFQFQKHWQHEWNLIPKSLS